MVDEMPGYWIVTVSIEWPRPGARVREALDLADDVAALWRNAHRGEGVKVRPRLPDSRLPQPPSMIGCVAQAMMRQADTRPLLGPVAPTPPSRGDANDTANARFRCYRAW